MDRLRFGTAGIPDGVGQRTYKDAFEYLHGLGLDCMEVEFVYGVRMDKKTALAIQEEAEKNDIKLSAHGPYYINLNSLEEEKISASIKRILSTARTASLFGGYSITYHAAFYQKMDKEYVYKKVRNLSEEIVNTLKEENIKIWIRPETTGKSSQWGDLDEIIRLSKEVDMILPCVDFSHLFARSGGEYNSYDDFAKTFEKIGKELGSNTLNEFHAHISGIEYGDKGEKKHLPLVESDFNYKDLMKAFKDFNVKGVVICESPILEKDALLLKKIYNNL